jgi:hypothetical protein
MNNLEYTNPPRWKALVLSISFLAVIFFPLINKKAGLIREDRNPDFSYSRKPVFNVAYPDSFPALYEKYFNENIGFTTHALKLNAYWKINILESSPNQRKALVGKNNWLFLSGKPLNDYRGLNLLSAAEMEQLKSIMHGRAVRLKDKGIEFYLAVAPNKHRVYSEYLPNNIISSPGSTIFDQVIEALGSDSLIHLIDLRQPLDEAKKEHVLYYRKDNHWNDYGAWVGYNTIIENVNKNFPNVLPVSQDHFSVDSTRNLVGGDALQLGVDDLIKENRVMFIARDGLKAHTGTESNYTCPKDFAYTEDFEIVKEVDDQKLPKALIIRDSFTDFMLPFLSENFSKTTFIFDNWEYKENKNIVEHENPDIVMIIIIEQNLRRILECDLL